MFHLHLNELHSAHVNASSEEAENASELSPGTVGVDSAIPNGNRSGMDALGVQGNQIRRYIHSFDDA
jgi:serine/threonine-protein phosphatase 2B catalytic subunit